MKHVFRYSKLLVTLFVFTQLSTAALLASTNSLYCTNNSPIIVQMTTNSTVNTYTIAKGAKVSVPFNMTPAPQLFLAPAPTSSYEGYITITAKSSLSNITVSGTILGAMLNIKITDPYGVVVGSGSFLQKSGY